MLKESAPKIVRLYGKKLEKSDFPILGRDARSKRQVDRKTDEELKEISMHNIIRKEGKEYAETLREYDSFFRSLSEDELQSDRKKHKTYLKNMQSYHQCLTNATICELQNYEAVFCTTSVATKGQIFTNKNVYQVIIDEAGMCTEPETIAAIVALAAKQVVLIGDHQQLRPVVNCLEAGKLGLEKSMFEQYAELSEDPELSRFIKFTTLTTQYRMHDKICEFPSNQFYKGQLKTHDKDECVSDAISAIWPVQSSPIVFCHVGDGVEEKLTHSMEDGNELSRNNKAEVQQVVRIYTRLMKLGINPRDVNVMSQYNSQCSELRKALRTEHFVDFQVNTVFQSQGGEWDYVIFSTVCSLPEYRIEPEPTLGWQKANLGFITDHHQINVALTRAKKGMIIVGNKNLLRCEEKVWRHLIKYYEKEKCLVDAKFFPKAKKRKRRSTGRALDVDDSWFDV